MSILASLELDPVSSIALAVFQTSSSTFPLLAVAVSILGSRPPALRETLAFKRLSNPIGGCIFDFDFNFDDEVGNFARYDDENVAESAFFPSPS